MAEAEIVEGRGGVARVEAFSDGVLAIIITIMVLELKTPHEDGLAHLWRLWPVFIAYVLSFTYVAIYWVNHHRMFGYASSVSGALLWANMVLLFTLSLVPFSTAYLGEHHFSLGGALLYLATMLLPALAYSWLQAVIRRHQKLSVEEERYHRATGRKGLFSLAVYTSGLALCFASPWLGVACAAIVALAWIVPWGPVDRLFLAGPQSRRTPQSR